MGETYTEQDIQVLEGLQAVRMRPGMYIGSTGPRGLHHLVFEIVDNAIDEALAGYCDRIEVTLDQDQVVTVRDNGRGIPTGIHATAKIPVPELIFTKLHAGGKFGGDSYKVSGGLHGVGSSVVNALSIFFEYEIAREGSLYYGRFENGGNVAIPMERKGNSRRKGTTVRFRPDPSIFETINFTYKILRDRLQELAYINPNLTISFSDKRKELVEEVWCYADGIKDFVTSLNEGTEGFGPIVHFNEESEGYEVEVAFQYNDGYSESLVSFVNCINTAEGGQHETGYRTAHTRVFNEYARRMGLWKKKDNLSGEDLREGLTCILNLRAPDPEFEGQTKTKLGTTEARAIVDAVVSKHFSIFLEENPKIAQGIIYKAGRAKTAREAARKARDLSRSGIKSGLTTSLGGKLTRCSSRKAEECELFIVEGDSAGGSAKQGRDRRTQAILPLRGKPLNTERAHLEKLLQNKEIVSIIQSLGAGVGADFQLGDARYGRVIILADADDDGAHIRCLLLTFFYRYMKPLVAAGGIYIAQPPLFKVESAKGGRGKKKSVYAYSQEEMQEAVDSMDNKVVIQRYKGLGEMNPSQLWDTTLNPETRTLLQVTVDDVVSAERQLRVLMGSNAEIRRNWITDNVEFGEEGERDTQTETIDGVADPTPSGEAGVRA